MNQQYRRSARRGISWLVPMVLLSLGAGIAGVVYMVFVVRPLGEADDKAPLMTTVKREHFIHLVTDRGEIESASNVEVRCEVQSTNSQGVPILWLIPEGQYVEAGEKLIEFDSAALREAETQQQIVYEQARAAMIQAELTFETAKIAVEEYQHGTFKQEMQLIESEIVVAEENLRRAQDYARYSEQLAAKGYVTKVQLEADQFAVTNAQIQLESCRTRKQVLEKYTKEKTLKQLQSDVGTFEAQMLAQKSSFKLEEETLAHIRTQVEKCVVVAPSAGQVVYANETDRRGNQETEIVEGALIRERKVVIRLPDASKMQVRAKVNEGNVGMVEPGQPAVVRVDALPGRELHGTVTRVDPIAMPTHWFTRDVKEYATFVSIDDPPTELKPGMTAEVSIVVDHREDALLVPCQTVLEREGKHFCFQHSTTGPKKLEVAIGPTNDKFLVIQDGLREGEKIVLNPRLYLRELTGDDPMEKTGPAKQGFPMGKFKGKQMAGGPAGKSSPAGKQKPQVEQPLAADDAAGAEVTAEADPPGGQASAGGAGE